MRHVFLGQHILGNLGSRNGDEGIELGFEAVILAGAFRQADAAGADIQPYGEIGGFITMLHCFSPCCHLLS